MATYTKARFLIDVAKEAKAIKKHATKKEISMLDISSLNPNSRHQCVYGQMTGDCKSSRACELIINCCSHYINNSFDRTISEAGFSAIKKNVNGVKIEGVNTPGKLRKDRDYGINHLSALEAYILLKNAKNKNLIAFLKGERKDLVL